jgi:hypothetical protein
MWILRLLLLSSLLASSALFTDQGSGIDPNGGGAMDPNGGSNVGSAIDPDGARLCYSACVDPNG